MNTDSAMVVLSGGQDSTTCLLMARDTYKTVHAITFDYGQRHAREIEAAREVARIVGVDSHEVVNVRGLLRSTSPLTDPKVELETYTNFEAMDKIIGDRVELTFVPLRNPFFLTVAANYALHHGCRTLVTGVCAMDNANYPDCTPDFITAMEQMINVALGIGVDVDNVDRFRIATPLLRMTKAQTVKAAMSYPLGEQAMAHTHTCYAGEFPPCGRCHACVLRAEGFRLAGVPDPLVERAGEVA
jgi:7-cyano-7-deazaguanine synthase